MANQCNAQTDALSLSSGSGAAGSNVALNLSLASVTGSEPAAVEFSVNYPSDQMTSFSAVAGPAATAAGKSLTCSGQTCLVYGVNNQIIQNGVVAVLSFQTAANASGNLVVQLNNSMGAAPVAAAIAIGGTNGMVSIQPISITLTPTSSSLLAGQTQQFNATVTNTSNTAVTWSINPNLGSISASGLYTAPATLNGAQTVTLTASSAASPAITATATISLNPAIPTLTGVSPNSGLTVGGTLVTIAGTNFAAGATVQFGGIAATNVSVLNSTSITATTPVGNAGAVAVTITSPGAPNASLTNGFTYLASSRIAYVQGSYAAPQTPQTSVTVTYPSAQTARNLNVIVVGWRDSTNTVKSVTDQSGNTYTLAAGPTVQHGFATQSIYYAKNIVAPGLNTVTVTFSGAAAFADIRILEYSGIDTNNPVDVTAVRIGDSATSASGFVTTTSAKDLLFAANLAQSTTAAGIGYTARLLTQPNRDIVEDRVVNATGSYRATAPISSSNRWIMQMVAFRAAH